MALVRANASSLLEDALAGKLHELLAQQARIQFDAETGRSEVRSWELSLPAFLTDVRDAGLGHVEVLLEHKLPYTPKRVDVVLCGVHPKTRQPTYVLVELKQWTNAVSLGEGLVQVPQYGQPVLHPVEQVRGYWPVPRRLHPDPGEPLRGCSRHRVSTQRERGWVEGQPLPY